ncbi:hypothetical protein ABPG72_002355 [Tetrahymena utriculariae]
MQNAYPVITDQHREFLKKQGLKVYEPKPLPDQINPFSKSYWITNTFIVGVSLLARRHALKVGSPRILWSGCIVGVPLAAIISRGKSDQLDELVGARKTLEQKLEYAPITRRAWERALTTNQEYQNEIKNQIQDLQAEIAAKKAAAKLE